MRAPEGADVTHLREELNAAVLDIARELIKPEPDSAVIAGLDDREAVLRASIRERTPPEADTELVSARHGW